MAYTYACRDFFGGFNGCPAEFHTAEVDELWEHIEVHGRAAHNQEPTRWSEDDRERVLSVVHED